MNKFLCILLMVLLLTPILSADDLYKVVLQSNQDITQLHKIGAEPLVKLNNGYLILLKENAVDSLVQPQLDLQLIKQNIKKENLVIDTRLDNLNVSKENNVFQEDALRIFELQDIPFAKSSSQPDLMTIRNSGLKFEYEPIPLYASLSTATDIPLDSLIGLISQDSLFSYTSKLQEYPPRVAGSFSSDESRDWLVSKMESFGYDSVVVDSFVASISGSPTECQNVIGYKVGTVFPNHYVIFGCHRDAVATSPGADDNGSGSAAVLELARILFDIDTDMTIVFALFDAEEFGLHGSYHYAEEAYARGDSIVYMLNMDMIAEITNSTQAKVFHGSQTDISNLWVDLADSLVGITGILSGSSGGSDHYPFSQKGYEVSFIHEYIFSTVYHSFRDSTSYMDFDYMTKMVKASLATAYTVDQTYGPIPSFVFEYPQGQPEYVSPETETTFELNVTPIYGGVVVSGSELLYYSVDGGVYNSVQILETAPLQYLVTLPVVPCGQTISYYIQVDELVSGTIYAQNPSSPIELESATEKITAFADDFETDKGWTISGGDWERGTPTGGGGAYGNADPSSAHSGTNVYGYNLDGDYANSIPQYHLTSPAIDCTGLSNLKLRFWRWLGIETSVYDHASISLSTNGVNFATVWSNSGEVADNAWTQMEYYIGEMPEPQNSVYIRFTMGTTDGGWQYCGWNIDDLELSNMVCDFVSNDADSDGIADEVDNCPTIHNPEQIDTDNDGIGDACDGCCLFDRGNVDNDPQELVDISDLVYLVDYMFMSGPAPICWDEGNVDGDEENLIDISDLVYLVGFMFTGPEFLPLCP